MLIPRTSSIRLKVVLTSGTFPMSSVSKMEALERTCNRGLISSKSMGSIF